jgi:DHA1 family tetracycline resistance protein-like MFS transporter
MTKFDYNTNQIGSVLAFNGALYALFQYLVVQRISKSFKPETMFKYSVMFSAIAIISLLVSKTSIELYIAMSIFVMAMGFAIPGVITFIANQGDKSEQGQVMGIINSIQAFSTVLVMIIAGYINSISNTYAIIISCSLIVISWLYFIFIDREKNNSQVRMLVNSHE